MNFSSNLRGILCMVLAGITFVSCDTFLKLILEEGVPPLQALVLRGVAAILCCFILVVATGFVRELPKALGLWTILRSLAEIGAVIAFIIALAHVPLADVTAIYQIAPLLVLAGASFIWGEQVGWLRWLLIGFGLVGALCVAQPGADGASPYALLAFITAASSAVRDLLTRKAPQDTPGVVIAFNVVVMVFLAALIGSIMFEDMKPVTPRLAAYGLASGFFVAVAHYFVFMAFRLTTARAVAPFYYTFTLCAVVFGAVFFGEYPNTLAIAGIGLIIACGLGVLALENRKGAES